MSKFDTERLNQISWQELEAHGLITKSEHGDKAAGHGYCCVYCNSGRGRNRSGGLDFDFTGDIWEHVCRSCNTGGDNIKFFQQVYNADFAEACRLASEEFNIPYLDGDAPARSFKTHSAPPPIVGGVKPKRHFGLPAENIGEGQLELIKVDIKTAQDNLINLPWDNSERKTFRGLDIEVLKYFKCGYLAQWKHPKCVDEGTKTYPSPRLIVPTEDGIHYLARLIDIVGKFDKSKPKLHAGNRLEVFNASDLQFETLIVTEGEINAMSIFQSLYFSPTNGFELNDRKVGIVSTMFAGGWKSLIAGKIDAGLIPFKRFILLFDNDDTGETQADELEAALKERNFCVTVKFLSDYCDWNHGDKIDANDLLIKNPVELKQIVNLIIGEADKEFGDVHDRIIRPVKQEALLKSDSMVGMDAFAGSKKGGYVGEAPLGEERVEKIKAAYEKHMAAPKKTLAELKKEHGDSNSDTDAETDNPESTSASTDESSSDTGTPVNAPDNPNSTPLQTDNFLHGADINALIGSWEVMNGKINPEMLPTIHSAANYLRMLKSSTLTPEIVLSPKTIQSLAVCKFYTFYAALADSVQSDIKAAKKSADNDLAQISVRDLNSNVEKTIRQLRKDHKNFIKASKQAEADAEAAKKKSEAQDSHAKNICRLEELKAQPQSSERDAKMVRILQDTVEWKRDRRGNREVVRNTAANITLILKYDPYISELIGYEEFRQIKACLRQAPWQKDNRVGTEWRDSDDSELRFYLRSTYVEFSDHKLIDDAVTNEANRHSYHEVKDFINSLPKWDCVKRMDSLFIHFLGAADNLFNRVVTRCWLMGLFARLFHPGCDFQYCLVLRGAQRIGKSRLLEMLAGRHGVNPKRKGWHVSIKDSLDDSHAVDALQKGWIIELEELAAVRKADITSIKSFISASEDTRRFAYERNARTAPRHVAIAATTNAHSFLNDPTGNARFLVVECTKETYRQVAGMTPEYIRQVLAEAYHEFQELFKDGFDESKLQLPANIRIESEERNNKFLQDDGMMSELLAWINIKIPPPAVWNLLSREERARFCQNGGSLTEIDFEAVLNHRRRNIGGDDDKVQADIDVIDKFFSSKHVRKSGENHFTISGSEYRTHICPAEIINEVFASNDKRKTTARINELFSTLEGDGWTRGSRYRKDSVYADQKKILFRDADNYPDIGLSGQEKIEAQMPNSTVPATPTDYSGSVVDPDDMPF